MRSRKHEAASPSRVSRLCRFHLVMAIVILLVACGGNSDVDSGVTECEAGFRLFDHEKLYRGPVCVPDDPQEIVSLGIEMETLVALGLSPTGAQERFIDDIGRNFPDQAGVLADTADIANPPNVESISSLNPDLIIGTTREGQQEYRSLSQIAPTILFTHVDSSEWKETAFFIADAINQTDEINQIFDEYNSRITDIQDQLSTSGDLAVSVMRVRQGRIQVYLPGSFPGTVIGDIGLERPESQQSDEFALELSLEELKLADADIIYIYTFGASPEQREASDQALSELYEERLWNSLDAVKNESVYEMPDYWIGGGILAANAIVEDVLENLNEN
ncbi:MAG: iron-siderophore ABC transporter substrate-binding protein [Chloroflexota bacterium]